LISSTPKPSSLFQSKLTVNFISLKKTIYFVLKLMMSFFFLKSTKSLAVNNLTRKSSSTVSHAGSKHWSAERIVGAALIAVIPIALIADNQITDGLLASSLMVHVWWGLKEVLTDYQRKLHLPKSSFIILNLICAAAFVGLLYFNYVDIGLSRAIKKIWFFFCIFR